MHDLDVVQFGVPMHHAGRKADGEGGEDDHERGEDTRKGGVDNGQEGGGEKTWRRTRMKGVQH